jgi:glutamate/aspartate transport system substrate-binding protein
MSICTRAALAFLACLVAGETCAQEAVGVEKLTGTLAKVKQSGKISVGYRDASVPFSYIDPTSKQKQRDPIGYSIDICLAIIEDIRGELGDDTIQVKYVPVNAQNRIPLVIDGTVDLECGQTTNNAERRKLVAFSPIIFVSGTKLMVKRGSSIGSYRDLKGKTVVATSGSTNEAAVKAIDAKLKLGLKLMAVSDNAEAFAAVGSGQADAWAGDDGILYATAAESKNPRDFVVLEEFMSYDPYGIMYRKDDRDLDALVKKNFEKLAETRELARFYEQWFLRKLPSGRTVGLPMSEQLQGIFEALGQPTE